MGHKGGHEDEYHEIILERLDGATHGLTPHTSEYTEAVKEALKTAGKEIIKDGTQMNKWATVRKGNKK